MGEHGSPGIQVRQRLADGDQSVIGVLYRRYGGRMLALALAGTDSRREADDLVQEALVRAWREAGSLSSTASIGGWLFRITCDVVLERMQPSNPQRLTEQLSQRWLARVAIDELPTDEREMVRLRRLDGLSAQETALRLGVSGDLVQEVLQRFDQRLAALLTRFRGGRDSGRPAPTADRNQSVRSSWLGGSAGPATFAAS